MEQIDADIEDWKNFLSFIDECTDDYIYIYDLSNDHAIYSKRVTDTFALECAEFENAGMRLKDVIYPDDYEAVFNNISDLQNGIIKKHDMEYRWRSKKNGYVWISCRGVLVRKNNINYMIGRVAEIGKKNRYDNITGLYTESVFEEEYNSCIRNETHTGYGMLIGIDNFKEINEKYGSQAVAEIGKKNRYDNITGLYTESVFEEEYNSCIRNETHTGYGMLIGIDNFKEINEKYGSQAGDEVLSMLSSVLLKEASAQSFKVYRMKGDEYAVLMLDVSGDIAENARQLYKQIRTYIDKTISDRGYAVFFNISAGACTFDSQSDSFKELSKKMRFALHSAKLNGKNRFEFYDEKEYAAYLKRLQIQDELRSCVNDNYKGFELFYQPIVNVATGKIIGAEALIRWNSEKYGFMSPVDFIPLLEESSLIIPLGRWIVDTAAEFCSRCIDIIPDFVMHVNLSFVQIIKSDVKKDVLENISRHKAANNHYVLEITESIQMDSNIAVKRVLDDFVSNGFLLAIDDFGTGYSNFEYMKDRMFGILKVDRSFVTDIHNNDNNSILVGFIIKMAHEMGTKICAEGVETKEELEKIRNLGADYIQGYYYSRPVGHMDFWKLITA